MRFSLIVATFGRTEEMRNLLLSLASQTEPDFEVVVVDQNSDERLVPILAAFAGLDMPASSALTQERLGWRPTGPGLLSDLNAMRFEA